MPKQIGQDAESILNQTAAQKKATTSKATASYAPTYANAKLGMANKPTIPLPYKLPTTTNSALTKSSAPGVNSTYAPTKSYPVIPTQAPVSYVPNKSIIPTWVGNPQFYMPQGNMGGQGIGQKSDPRFDYSYTVNGMMNNGGRMNSDYDTDSIMGGNGAFRGNDYVPYRPGQMNVSDEDKMAYLWDNYSYLFPEQTSSMDDEEGGSGGGYGLESYIPMPDMGWGGGGYGNQDYLRDSGLINWRI